MASSKILVVALAAIISLVNCSGVAPVFAPIAYRQVAPPNIVPFAASVNTFTKGLPLYAAPYAAGVAPVAPAVPYLPAPGPVFRTAIPAPVLPAEAAPVFPGAVPGAVPVARAVPAYPGVAPVYPGFAPPLVHPSVAYGARSVHAVAPGLVPALPPQYVV